MSRSTVVVWIVRDQLGEVVDEFTNRRAAIAAAYAVGPALAARAYRRSDGTYDAVVLRCVAPTPATPNVFEVAYNGLGADTYAEAIAEARQWIANHATAQRKGTT